MPTPKRQLDLQAKITLILVSVILPIFLIVTIAENKLTLPLLEEEIRQMGISSGKTLASEIESTRLLALPTSAPRLESSIQDLLYTHPDILRIDVIAKDSLTGQIKAVASNVDEDSVEPTGPIFLVEGVSSEFKRDEKGTGAWEISVPIEHHSRDFRIPKKLLGNVRIVVSTQLVGQIVGTLWKTKAIAAGLSVIALLLTLSYFLRKTIANDRLLRRAESENLNLTEQLQETQRELMVTEKMAVMGQLAGQLAHEIGTPLNAIGGHLHLLRHEISPAQRTITEPRLDIVEGQLGKIEEIVKGFLQSTAKPTSQKQLVDLNRVADKTLSLVTPRMEFLGVDMKKKFDQDMGPIRVVPIDVEQILLNLLNNSLDSMTAKAQGKSQSRPHLSVGTTLKKAEGKVWAEVSIYDTGEGIRRGDLKNVLKPFFTTKRPDQGTGLGLTISQQVAQKYGGDLMIDSKEGAWTRVTLRLPYPT